MKSLKEIFTIETVLLLLSVLFVIVFGFLVAIAIINKQIETKNIKLICESHGGCELISKHNGNTPMLGGVSLTYKCAQNHIHKL